MKKNKIGLLIIFIGIIIVLYPLISNIIASYTQTTVISNYNKKINLMTEEEIELEKSKAQKYNERLTLVKEVEINDVSDEKEKNEAVSYLNVLNIGEIMGYISIPKIEIYLPIYHGTDEKVLQAGVGHVENTSFPIGEKNTHTVLAGHSGLARTKIFDELDKLEEGDEFFIYIFEDVFKYKVDQIKTVLPENTKDIQIEEGKEYVTLLTCTPFAVNTHRLLVRGERIENSESVYENPAEDSNKYESENTTITITEDLQNIDTKIKSTNKILLFTIGIAIIIIGFVIISIREDKKIRKRAKRVKEKIKK